MHRNLRSLFLMLGLCALALPASAELSVEATRIAHGVEAWYVESPGVPVVDLQLSFEGAGTVSDPADKSGRAAFAASLLTEGAGTLSAQQFQQALDENAISLDVEAGVDRLTVHVHCLRDHAVKAGELLALALTAPTTAEPDIARIKGQFASLFLQLEENPGYQAERLLQQRAFKNHPYANPEYGTPASIATLGAQDVRDYLNTYVTRDNVVISAAGDVDRHLLNDMLTPMLNALHANDTGPVAITKVLPQGGGEILHQQADVPQTVIAFTAPGIGRNDPRFYTAYLLNHILGGNALSSRLSEEVRQKKGLVYSVDTGLDARIGTSLLSGALATRNSSGETALAEVKAVLKDMHDKGVTTEECNDAKSYVLGHFPLQLDSSSSIATMLMVMQTNHLGERYMHDRIALFEKVKCSDINALAHELLSPEKFLFAVVGGTADDPAPVAAVHNDAH